MGKRSEEVFFVKGQVRRGWDPPPAHTGLPPPFAAFSIMRKAPYKLTRTDTTAIFSAYSRCMGAHTCASPVTSSVVHPSCKHPTPSSSSSDEIRR